MGDFNKKNDESKSAAEQHERDRQAAKREKPSVYPDKHGETDRVDKVNDSSRAQEPNRTNSDFSKARTSEDFKR